jgi:hypothetical protein
VRRVTVFVTQTWTQNTQTQIAHPKAGFGIAGGRDGKDLTPALGVRPEEYQMDKPEAQF